jgi:hypothetical protein
MVARHLSHRRHQNYLNAPPKSPLSLHVSVDAGVAHVHAHIQTI